MIYRLFLIFAGISLLYAGVLFSAGELETTATEEEASAENTPAEDKEIEASAEVYAMFMYASDLEEEQIDKAEKVYLAIVAKEPDAAYVYYRLARLYWRKSDTVKASEFFDKAIEKNPELKEAYTDYAIIRRITGDNKGANEIYEKAVKASKDNLDLYRILADSYVLEKETEKSLETWMRAAAEHPKEPEPWVNAIRLNLLLKKTSEAKEVYEKGLKETNGTYKFLEGARDAYLRGGIPKTADNIGMKLLEIRPNSVNLWIEHINFLLSSKDNEGAKKAYETAAPRMSQRPDYFFEAGTTFQDFADSDTAMQIYLEGLKYKPEDGNLLLALAVLYEKRGESDKSRECYEKLLKLKPNSPEYYLKIAKSQEKEGLYEKALETYREAAKHFPTSKEVNISTIRILLRLGRFPESEVEFEKLVALYPDDIGMKIGYLELLNINGKYDRAIEFGGKLLGESPSPELLQEMSVAFAGKKEYGKAAEYFEQAMKKAEGILPADYLRLGMLYRKAGDEAKAKDSFEKGKAVLEKAAAEGDEKYKALYGLATIYEYLGDKAKAGEYYQKAADELKATVEKTPDDVSLIISYADLLQKVGKPEEAEKYYIIAIEKDPNDASALNNLAYMWIEKGEKLDKALEYVKRALEIDPGNSAYLDSLGWALYKKKKYEEAVVELKKAIEAGADDPVMFDHMGDAFNKTKKYPEAIANWEKALGMDPQDPDEIKAKIDDAKKKLEK
jgi:tetratricopeptide (TPR) repeat protein